MKLSKRDLQRIILEEVENYRSKGALKESTQEPEQMLQTVEDVESLLKQIYTSPTGEDTERFERVAQLLTVLKTSISALGGSGADEGGYSTVPGQRPMQEGGEVQNAAKGAAMELLDTAKTMEQAPSHEPASDYAQFVAKQANLIMDMLVQMEDDEAGRHPGGSIGEANEGGEGVHDIMNLPEPEAVESSGNPKEDALRNIVAQGQRAKVDGPMMDLFSASAVVQVLDALSPKNKEHYLGMPPLKMAEIAFKLAK